MKNSVKRQIESLLQKQIRAKKSQRYLEAAILLANKNDFKIVESFFWLDAVTKHELITLSLDK